MPAVDLTLLKPVTQAALRGAIGRVMTNYLPAALEATGDKRERVQPQVKISGFSHAQASTGPGRPVRSGPAARRTVTGSRN